MEEVLPIRSKTRQEAEKANKKFMAASGKGKRRHEGLDPDKLRGSLRDANLWFIAEFGERLTATQIALLETINDEEDLVTLVALWERLRGLNTNLRLLAKAEAKNTRDPKMIHGAGGLKGEDTGKLTGKLSSVGFIAAHRPDYEASEEEAEPGPQQPPTPEFDDMNHRP
jgi:hypothetical protein